MQPKRLLIPLILCAALAGCQSTPTNPTDSTAPESSATESTSSPMTTIPETTITDTTLPETTTLPESAEPIVVNSSDGRFTATIASPSSDLIVTDNETKESITVYKANLNDIRDSHAPESPEFFGDKLYYKVIGYEWFEGIGVYDCPTGKNIFYPTKTGNSPILISDDVILTVDNGHGNWIYTVYKATLDGQINETPIASVQGDISSCSFDGSTPTFNMVDGSTKVVEISDTEPMLSRDLSDIMAKLGEKYPDFGVRKSLKSMELLGDFLTVRWRLESCDVAAEINIQTCELISSETDTGGSQDKPKSSELTSPDGRFTAYQNDDSDLYLTDNQTGDSILVEKANISNDAQLARKPVPACFADGTLYFNVLGYEGYQTLGVYDCLTSEKTLYTIAPDHYPVYVGADAVITSNYDYGEVPKEYFRVELKDGKAVETSISSGKLPDVIPEWYVFDPSTLRVGLFLDDVLWIYDLNETVAPVEVSSLSAGEREIAKTITRLPCPEKQLNSRFEAQNINDDLYVLDKETNESKLIYKAVPYPPDINDVRLPRLITFIGDDMWFDIAGIESSSNGFGIYNCLTGGLRTFDTNLTLCSIGTDELIAFGFVDHYLNICSITIDDGLTVTPLIDRGVIGIPIFFDDFVFDADTRLFYYIGGNSFGIADLSAGTQKIYTLECISDYFPDEYPDSPTYLHMRDSGALITSDNLNFVWRVNL